MYPIVSDTIRFVNSVVLRDERAALALSTCLKELLRDAILVNRALRKWYFNSRAVEC